MRKKKREKLADGCKRQRQKDSNFILWWKKSKRLWKRKKQRKNAEKHLRYLWEEHLERALRKELKPLKKFPDMLSKMMLKKLLKKLSKRIDSLMKYRNGIMRFLQILYDIGKVLFIAMSYPQ